jgi:hypothetical protein
MSFKASKEKISKLLRQKAEEATDAIQNIAERQPIFRKSKAFLNKAAETSKIGVAGIFAGVFCILFSLLYTMICYANRKE